MLRTTSFLLVESNEQHQETPQPRPSSLCRSIEASLSSRKAIPAHGIQATSMRCMEGVVDGVEIVGGKCEGQYFLLILVLLWSYGKRYLDVIYRGVYNNSSKMYGPTTTSTTGVVQILWREHVRLCCLLHYSVTLFAPFRAPGVLKQEKRIMNFCSRSTTAASSLLPLMPFVCSKASTRQSREEAHSSFRLIQSESTFVYFISYYPVLTRSLGSIPAIQRFELQPFFAGTDNGGQDNRCAYATCDCENRAGSHVSTESNMFTLHNSRGRYTRQKLASNHRVRACYRMHTWFWGPGWSGSRYVVIQMVSTAGIAVWMHKGDDSNIHYIVCRRPQTVAQPSGTMSDYTACEGLGEGMTE